MKQDAATAEYQSQVTCIYNGEKFDVRDNGAVFRFSRSTQRVRIPDNQWTFGISNSQDGYLEIASVPIHRIVATAFHGTSPTEWHVVDHIDADKYNNRPDNLRWVTNLENILLDPITAKRIARRCGSVEAFLSDPPAFREKLQEPKLFWIGNISKEEGQRVLACLLALAAIDTVPSNGALDRWLVNRIEWMNYERKMHIVPNYTKSKTSNAVQCDWKIPSEFPCCPDALGSEPLVAYFENLEPGLVFAANDMYTTFIMKFAMANDRDALIVLTENPDGINRWAIAEITFEGELFVHKNLGSFVKADGSEKYFCIAQGLEWTGKDTFDDFC